MTLTEMFHIAFPRYNLPIVQVVPVIHEKGIKYIISCPADHGLADIEINFFKYGDVLCKQQVNMHALTLLHFLLKQQGFLS